MHRYLPRTIRLSITVALSGAVLASAFALPAAAAVPGSKAYVVRAGDTLAAIASKQGLGDWRLIYDANTVIKHPDLIYPGQRLAIPPKGAKLAHRPLLTPQPVQVQQWRPVHRSNWRSQQSTQFTSSRRSSWRSSSRSSSVAGGGVWDRLAQCESGGNWGTSTGNGFYGGLQFTPGSWRAAGGSGMPHTASRSEQIRVAQNLQRRQGWGAWPACSSKLGLR
jgi:LysM repeat protein